MFVCVCHIVPAGHTAPTIRRCTAPGQESLHHLAHRRVNEPARIPTANLQSLTSFPNLETKGDKCKNCKQYFFCPKSGGQIGFYRVNVCVCIYQSNVRINDYQSNAMRSNVLWNMLLECRVVNISMKSCKELSEPQMQILETFR